MHFDVKKFGLAVFLIALASIILTFFNQPKLDAITGEVISEIVRLDKTTFEPGEQITGSVSLSLDDADLIPITTSVFLLVGDERPETPVYPDKDTQISPPSGDSEGEGEPDCFNYGSCCYPGTGIGEYYGTLGCGPTRTECWSSCTKETYLFLTDFIQLSDSSGKGELLFGNFNNVNGQAPQGEGYGFSGCNLSLSLSQCEIYGGQCATSCGYGFMEYGFSCSSSSSIKIEEGESEGEIEEGESEGGGGSSVCCIPTSFNTPCELAGGTCAESCGFGEEENLSLSCAGEIVQEGELVCCSNQYSCDGWNNIYNGSISSFNLTAPSDEGNYILTMEIKSNNSLSSTTLYSSNTTFATTSTSNNGEGESESESESEGELTYCGDSICNGIENCTTCSQDCGSCQDSNSKETVGPVKEATLFYVILPALTIIVVATLLILYFRKKGKKEIVSKPKDIYPKFAQTVYKKPIQRNKY